MIDEGTLALATIQRKVVVVRAIKSHAYSDRSLDVLVYLPFGERLFITPPNVHGRRVKIPSKDLLFIFSASDYPNSTDPEMIELPPKAYDEYVELTAMNRRKLDLLWSQLNCPLKIRRW